MIRFTSLKYKNFLSTGDNFTEVQLDYAKSTLVVGQNGAGKSTMLDALSFALFGKAHRNVNKPQLINSVNNKNCLVEVEFSVNASKYKIVRGLKPTVFEIWKDDTMINQSSHAKEYQKVLEQNILKLNHKSFHQIVVLGSSSFIPFMQLPAHIRREVIEDLLDINVFSKMNGLLKEKVSVLKTSIQQNEHALELNETKINSANKHIRDLEKISESAKREKENEIAEQKAELQRLDKLIEEYDDQMRQELDTKLTNLAAKVSQLEKYKFQFDAKLKKFKKDVKFYEDNDTCPTCDQEIADDTKDRKISESIKSKEEIESAGVELDSQLESLRNTIDEVQRNYLDKEQQYYAIQDSKRDVERIESRIRTLIRDMSTTVDDMDSLQAAKSDLEVLRSDREKLVDRKLQLSESREYNSVITELLKDSGIKTKIIKQYLPVINKLTNQYLQVLDFFVHFDLNEEFKETIRSRHRDAFSYDSFSEGEKQRIDLALLFTWRQVAKMKNSVATNLLILDETFDSSLDADGVDNLLKILDTLPDDTNIFVISHKGDLLDNKLDEKIEFVKVKNFSRIA